MHERALVADVMRLLGRPPGTWDLVVVERAVWQAVSAAQRLTRGRGFEEQHLAPAVAAVVVAAAARVVENPELSLTMLGSPFEGRPGGFSAWTRGELDVLRSAREGAPPHGSVRLPGTGSTASTTG